MSPIVSLRRIVNAWFPDEVDIYIHHEDESATITREEKADIQAVHKQVSISFRSPDCQRHFMPASDPQSLESIKVHLRRS